MFWTGNLHFHTCHASKFLFKHQCEHEGGIIVCCSTAQHVLRSRLLVYQQAASSRNER